jgi:Leucine-rich repeat (LRR) protein
VANHNLIASVPEGFEKMTQLQSISLSDNILGSIPNYFSRLSQLAILDVSYNQLTSLPPQFSVTLEELYLQNNRLGPTLSDSYGDLVNLQVLDVSNNRFESIPESFSNLRSLTQLYIANNKIRKIVAIVRPLVPKLRHISLRGNPLSDIPEETQTKTTAVLQFIKTGEQPASPAGRLKPKQLTRGASICDLILTGSPKLAQLSRSPSRLQLSSQPSFTSLPISNEFTLAVPCPGYDVEDGRLEKIRMKSRALTKALMGDEEEELLIAHSNTFYQNIFMSQQHSNFIAFDESHGYLCISILHDPEKVQDPLPFQKPFAYRALVRAQTGDKIVMLPEADSNKRLSRRKGSKVLVRALQTYLNVHDIIEVPTDPNLIERLVDLEDRLTVMNHKVAVLYTCGSQTEEEQFYNNEHGSPEFERFLLRVLGEKIELKDWPLFAGGLDTIGDRMGTHSVFHQHGAAQVMYHISTYLPFKASDPQKVTIIDLEVQNRTTERNNRKPIPSLSFFFFSITLGSSSTSSILCRYDNSPPLLWYR